MTVFLFRVKLFLMPRGSPFFSPASRWYSPLHWLVLIPLGLAIYAQTFTFNFVFDDFYFIVNNPYIKSFGHVHYVWKVFPETRAVGFYSFAFNYLINQLNPQGYHIFNFVIHLLATGLVWATATVLFKIAGGLSRDYQELPFVIAVLFLVHPCQTQAVTYISQRFESMATVFYLGTIYCYLCARISSSQTQKVLLFTGCAGLAILGIFTKEVVVTIPLMILAVELILLKRKSLNLKKSSSGLFLLITILGVIFVLLFMKMVKTDFIKEYFLFSAPSSSHDGDIITAGKYVLTQMRVFLTFIRLLILPINQNLDYDYPLSTGLVNPPFTLAGLCLISFIAFLIVRLRSKWPLIAFGLAWILITFSINTAPRVDVIFEHKLYLISFGFFLSTVCALSTVIKDRKILFGFLVILIAALSIVSYKRNQVWQNPLTLWQDVVQKSPHKARPYNGLGVAWDKQGDFIQALFNYNKAIELNPTYADAYNSRGNLYSKQGDFTKALSDYDKAISLSPGFVYPYSGRGDIYAKQNDFTQALSDYSKVITLSPDHARAYSSRGGIYVKQGNLTQALLDYSKAIEISPDDADAHNNRGIIYSREGKFAQAVSDFTRAIEINPNDADNYYNRGLAYSQEGRCVQAILDFTQGIHINPGASGWYYNRAVLYYQLKKYDRAWRDVDKAQSLGEKINPQFLEALRKVSSPE